MYQLYTQSLSHVQLSEDTTQQAAARECYSTDNSDIHSQSTLGLSARKPQKCDRKRAAIA